MTEPTPIATPSGYAPAYAIGYADQSVNLVLVSEERPLPVAFSTAAATAPAPFTGDASGETVAGPFAAIPDRLVGVALDGEWIGTVTLLRSTDDGVTLHPLQVGGKPWAVFTRPGFEQVWLETEAGATYYLAIALEEGIVSYQVSQ